jgi:hypothetical protein
VIEHRSEFLGQRIEVASCEITCENAAKMIGSASGHDVRYIPASFAENADIKSMMRWYAKVGYDVDLTALHAAYPEVGWTSAEAWAETQDWPRHFGEGS